MAFTAQSGLLKFGFILTIVLFFLGLVALGSLAKYASQKSPNCLISAAAAGLFAMDFVTWKKSENYKGKRASVATLLLAPVMCVFSFCTAITLALGIKSTMNEVEKVAPVY
ncbi:hypothetical protein BGX29_006818 [Mortierella sp. GBA35]|nr:hypothetical protein BGX29_006818 [Mortierella sp. GBA35]